MYNLFVDVLIKVSKKRNKEYIFEQEKFLKKANKTYEQYERYVAKNLSIDELHELVESVEEIKTCEHYQKQDNIKEKYEAINLEHLKKKVLMSEIFIN